MTRKPTRRIEFTVPEELGERYDEARGLIPMATWIKAIVADHIEANGNTRRPLRTNEVFSPHVMEQQARLQASADAKRAVRPIPKGKR